MIGSPPTNNLSRVVPLYLFDPLMIQRQKTDKHTTAVVTSSEGVTVTNTFSSITLLAYTAIVDTENY